MRRTALVVTAILLGACGFASQEEFGGRRIGDGISPWTSLGALRLCLGTHLVGAPASDPGGLCGDPARVDPPCLADGDCSSRESCVCGRCTVQYCTSNSDCTGGRICSFGGIDGNRCNMQCARSEDCAPGETCSQQRCVSGCDVDDECQAGEFCATIGTRRRCAVKACADDDQCSADGHVCKIQREPRFATEPTVLAASASDQPGFMMYVEMSDEFIQTERAIYRAVSSDGLNFRIDPAAPVVEDNGAAHAPTAVRDGTAVYLYYELGDGEEIRVAQSNDGIEFEAPATALSTSTAGVTAIRAPGAVFLDATEVGVYYQIADGSGIGLATGAAGGPLIPAGMALTPGDIETLPSGDASAFWIEITAVTSPHAAVTMTAGGEPSLRIWFSAAGRESGDSLQLGEVIPIAPNYSIGYASGSPQAPTNLAVWPYNPIFDRISVFVDHESELSPMVVQATDDAGNARETFFLYYLGADPDVTALETIGVARNGE